MKYILSLSIIAQVLVQPVHAQTASEVLRKYQTAISSFHTAEYTVQRIDTIGTAVVWNHSGHVVVQRNTQSNLLASNFLINRPDLAQSYYYNGRAGFDIDDKAKTFIVTKEPYAPTVLGSPAGQILVEELLAIDPDYQSITCSLTPEGEVLHLTYPDQPKLDVLARHTYLVLDKATHLPLVVRTSIMRSGRCWVTRKQLSGLRLNSDAAAETLRQPAFLAAYTRLMPVAATPAVSLTGQTAPDFRLLSLTKKPVRLRSYRGRVVVLDFWETTCAPCITSMPKMQQLQDQYSAKLVVIGVLLDPEASARAQGILLRQHARYLNVAGTKAEETAYRVTSFPRYIVISPKGKVLLDKEGGRYMQAVVEAVRLAIGT